MRFQSKKWSELDNVNKDQEVKFMDYISGMYFSTVEFVIIVAFDLLFNMSICHRCNWGSNFILLSDPTLLFIFSVAAAEQVIQQLKSENERLLSQVKDLTSEVASIRHAFLSSIGFSISQPLQ